jgi:hypothetical protein
MFAACSLIGWVALPLFEGNRIKVGIIVLFTLIAVAHLTSGLARRRLSGRKSVQ